MQGAKASAAMVLHKLSRNIPVSAQEGLTAATEQVNQYSRNPL